jgi:hypothetical protein
VKILLLYKDYCNHLSITFKAPENGYGSQGTCERTRTCIHTHKHKTQMLEEVSKQSLVDGVQKYLEQLQNYTLK